MFGVDYYVISFQESFILYICIIAFHFVAQRTLRKRAGKDCNSQYNHEQSVLETAAEKDQNYSLFVDVLMQKGKAFMIFHPQTMNLQASADFWKNENLLLPQVNPLLVVQCMVVILKAIYTQQKWTQSVLSLCLYICAHTCIQMYTTKVIKDKKTTA